METVTITKDGQQYQVISMSLSEAKRGQAMATVKKQEKLQSEAEITACYPKEWVTVEVVTTDRKGYWKKGRVIAHGLNREDSLRRLRYWRAKHPEARIAHVFTGPLMAEEVGVLIDLRTFPSGDRPYKF